MACADFSTEVADAAQTSPNYSVVACPRKDRAANAIGLKKKVQIDLDNEFGNDWYGGIATTAPLTNFIAGVDQEGSRCSAHTFVQRGPESRRQERFH